jgi:glycosyltransferase involved in cell wall biosynthesis
MAREVIGLSERVVVTSEFAARLARVDARPDDQERIFVVPLAYPDATGFSAGRDETIVASFGVVNEVKEPVLMVEALAALRGRGRDLRLVLAGPVGERDRATVLSAVARLGLEGRVELAGFLHREAYVDLLDRAGMAVQLRARTNGEASAAIHDCVAHGVPTVVTDLGAAGELPGFVEKVPPGVPADRLADRLAALLDDRARRKQMDEEGRAFAREHDFAHAADRILALAGVIELRERRPG